MKTLTELIQNYQNGAEKFGVKPEECMYVGDTSTDMKTGKAALKASAMTLDLNSF